MTYPTSAAKVLFAVLALLAVLAVLIWGLSEWRAATARATYPPAGEIVEVDGARVHAVVMGAGPDVVLIHGSNGNVRDMTFRLAETLAADYRVLILDRPGLGYSDPLEDTDSRIRAQADRLSKAAAALGAKAPVVLGQSYGGAVALAWGVYFPERASALVLISSPSHRWKSELEGLYKVMSRPVTGRAVARAISALVPTSYVRDTLPPVFDPQPMPDGYADHIGLPAILRAGPLHANARQRASLKDEITAMMPGYANLSLPIEAVHGSADDTVGLDIHARKLERDVPAVNLTVLEGVGHMPHQTHTDEVAAAVVRAFARAASHAGLR